MIRRAVGPGENRSSNSVAAGLVADGVCRSGSPASPPAAARQWLTASGTASNAISSMAPTTLSSRLPGSIPCTGRSTCCSMTTGPTAFRIELRGRCVSRSAEDNAVPRRQSPETNGRRNLRPALERDGRAGRAGVARRVAQPRPWNGRPLGGSRRSFRLGRASRDLDGYIEVQVHGGVSLPDDVESVVLDPSYRGTDVDRRLTAAGLRFGFEVNWHCGSELTVEDVTDNFRGPTMPLLARRVADSATSLMLGLSALRPRASGSRSQRPWATHLIPRCSS